MKITTLAIGLTLLAALPASFALAQQHPQHAPAAAATHARPAQRYATDATLRAQMREIRVNVLALEHAPHGHLTPQGAAQIADRITGHVNTIIANCRLPPESDAALHHIIGPLLADAGTLKADPGRTDAIAGMRRALDQYARQFDDPGFSEPNR